MQSKFIIIIGLVIISVAITSWGFLINYETGKISLDYKLILEQEGEDQILESIDGELSEPFMIKGTFTQHVGNVEQNILDIHSVVSDENINTGEIVFEASEIFLVDANTRKYHEDERYFIFPTNVKKQNYEMFHPIVAVPATFVYEETRIIDGLEVYVFSCEVFEQDISDFFTNFPQKKIFYDGKCMAFIEPVTGLEVDFELKWDNYFIENGVRGQQVELGYKKNTQDTVVILIQTAKNLKELHNIYKIIIPLVMGFIGSAILLILVLLNENKIKTKHIINARNEVIKKERLASIGELSARIAHDIRNPLTVVLNSLEYISLTKGDLKKQEIAMKRCFKAIGTITHQIDGVMSFLKDSELHLEEISLKKMLSSLVSDIIHSDEVNVNLPENDGIILADRIKINSLFYNLITNAVQAMENKGIITIRISDKSNDEIQIEIEDDGPPIPEEDIEKIFEPLFTTKQSGTGLGLASCSNIVKQHGGTISVKNNPTIFTVILPKTT